MNCLTEQIAICVEKGKLNMYSPYPPQMKGLPGADELTRQALEEGVRPDEILNDALVPAMNRVGQLFSENKIFVPQMLLSAKAMGASMNHLKPFFQTGEVKRKGVFIMGTVFGDLHDIGKNLCCMMVEGAGWEVSAIREKYPQTKVAVGGAPVNNDFTMQIRADAYSKDPQGLIEWLDGIIA